MKPKPILFAMLSMFTIAELGCGGAEGQGSSDAGRSAVRLAAPTYLTSLPYGDSELVLYWEDNIAPSDDIVTCYEVSSADFERPTYPFGFLPTECYSIRNGGTRIRIRDFDPFSNKSAGKTYFWRVRHHKKNTTDYSLWSNVHSAILRPTP